MSWYDPRSWAGDAAGAVTDRLSDQLHDVADHFLENPHQIVVAVGAAAAVIAGAYGAKRYGELYAEKMIQEE